MPNLLGILLSRGKAVKHDIKVLVSERIQIVDCLPFNKAVHNNNLSGHLQEFNELVYDFVVVSAREDTFKNTFNFVNNEVIGRSDQVVSA